MNASVAIKFRILPINQICRNVVGKTHLRDNVEPLAGHRLDKVVAFMCPNPYVPRFFESLSAPEVKFLGVSPEDVKKYDLFCYEVKEPDPAEARSQKKARDVFISLIRQPRDSEKASA